MDIEDWNIRAIREVGAMGFCVELALVKGTILEHFKGSVERWRSDRHSNMGSARSRDENEARTYPK